MYIGVYAFIIAMLIIFGFFAIVGLFGFSKKQEAIGIIMWIMVIPIALICFCYIEQDIRHESISYYSCISIDFGKNVGKKIVCITPNQEIVINNRQSIYPDNIIIKEYQYLAKKGLVIWSNGNQWKYDIMKPINEEYEKAKSNVVIINSKNLLSKGIL